MALTRDLVNGPPNEVTPTHLADTARALGKEFGFPVKILDKAQCEKLGMGAFLGVAAAAHEPCKFIVMDYTPKRKPKGTVCLVGKGITFDTGGISLKPAPDMDQMKYDMGGAGAVFGAMRFAASSKVPLRVVGIVAATENMPGGGAYKPGDILTSMAGTTIEIKNTDAEGRLVLADALAYAERFEPDAVVDLATLTGACVIALGSATAAMGNDEWLLDRITAAAETGGERMWAMPLWPEHRETVKSTVADIRNSTGREAGSLTAGAFLGAFTNAYRWVHLDIAGAAWNNRATGYMDAGAAGGGVRALCQFLTDWTKPRGTGPKPGPRTSLRVVKAGAKKKPAGSPKPGPTRGRKKTARKRK
jgi:leucyl aminopeptidase